MLSLNMVEYCCGSRSAKQMGGCTNTRGSVRGLERGLATAASLLILPVVSGYHKGGVSFSRSHVKVKYFSFILIKWIASCAAWGQTSLS